MINWPRHIVAVEECLAGLPPGTSVTDACTLVGARLGIEGLERDSLKWATRRYLRAAPRDLIGARYATDLPVPRMRSTDTAASLSGVCEIADTVPAPCMVPSIGVQSAEPVIDRLMKHCRKGIAFSALCDRLDLSPSKTQAAIESAKAAGYRVEVNGDTVAWSVIDPAIDDGETVDVPIKQIDNWSRFVVFSDTHFGSKFCLRKQLKDFLRYAIDKRGCTLALHAGDWTEGIEDKVRGELSHHDYHAQMLDMHEHMPHDIDVVSIYGNHDLWHAKHNGMDVARAMNDTLAGLGRTNIHVVGGMNKLLQVGGLRVRLTHPAGGGAYAKSYPAQKWTRDLQSANGRKPHLWFFGHRHRYVHFVDRGMHVFDVPCWQASGSDYGQRLHGSPSIGGLIVEVGQLDNGMVRAIRIEPVMYYEAEDVEPVPIRKLEYEVHEPSHIRSDHD